MGFEKSGKVLGIRTKIKERVISQMGVFCPLPSQNIASTSDWIDIGFSLDCNCIGLMLYSDWILLGFCLDWIDIGFSLNCNWTGLDQSNQPSYTSTLLMSL